MSDRTKLPKGWRLDTFPKDDGTGVVWVLFQATDDGRMCAVAGRDADSEGEAVEAARKVVEAQQPPSPLAWMVEVAREAYAGFEDDGGFSVYAGEVRSGDHDHEPEVQSGIRALRLALECRHVVEARPVPTDEELLKSAREDAAQVNDRLYPSLAASMRAGEQDRHEEVLCALQARRNMLREGAVAVQVAPVRDRDGNPAAYAPGDHVQKCTGDYQIGGVVRGVILTGAGLWRYAVEHQAEGGGAFLHIYAGSNLFALSTLPTREA